MSLTDQYKQLHKDKNLFAGTTIGLHKQSIRQGLELSQSKTILDYGCGKGDQYFKENTHTEYFFGIMPSLYDPGVDKFSILPPQQFDAVISTDVLEHIEEQDLDNVLREIFSKSTKFVYLGICNSPAIAILPDGRNAHVTQKSFDWWLDKIIKHSSVLTMVYVYGSSGGKAMIDNGVIKYKKIR